MLRNNHLTEQFFLPAQNVAQTINLSFPLPGEIHKNDLDNFLHSADGQQFIAGVTQIWQEIKAWATANGMTIPELTLFEGYYDLANTQSNSNYHLYTVGSYALAEIAHTLKNSTAYSNNAKISVLTELFTGLSVCPTGSYINLQNARKNLGSDLSDKLMSVRRQIGTHALVTAVLPQYIDHFDQIAQQDYYPGNEIHYANNILNELSLELGLNIVEDDFPIQFDKSSTIWADARQEISKYMTPEIIIDYIYDGLDIDNQLRNLLKAGNSPEEFSQLLLSLEQELKYYGIDTEWSQKFIFDYVDSLELKPDFEAQIKRSLLRRLANSGFMDIKKRYRMIKFSLSDQERSAQIEFHMLPNTGLKFSFALIYDADIKKYVPISIVFACLQQQMPLPEFNFVLHGPDDKIEYYQAMSQLFNYELKLHNLHNNNNNSNDTNKIAEAWNDNLHLPLTACSNHYEYFVKQFISLLARFNDNPALFAELINNQKIISYFCRCLDGESISFNSFVEKLEQNSFSPSHQELVIDKIISPDDINCHSGLPLFIIAELFLRLPENSQLTWLKERLNIITQHQHDPYFNEYLVTFLSSLTREDAQKLIELFDKNILINLFTHLLKTHDHNINNSSPLLQLVSQLLQNSDDLTYIISNNTDPALITLLLSLTSPTIRPGLIDNNKKLLLQPLQKLHPNRFVYLLSLLSYTPKENRWSIIQAMTKDILIDIAKYSINNSERKSIILSVLQLLPEETRLDFIKRFPKSLLSAAITIDNPKFSPQLFTSAGNSNFTTLLKCMPNKLSALDLFEAADLVVFYKSATANDFIFLLDSIASEQLSGQKLIDKLTELFENTNIYCLFFAESVLNAHLKNLPSPFQAIILNKIITNDFNNLLLCTKTPEDFILIYSNLPENKKALYLQKVSASNEALMTQVKSIDEDFFLKLNQHIPKIKYTQQFFNNNNNNNQSANDSTQNIVFDDPSVAFKEISKILVNEMDNYESVCAFVDFEGLCIAKANKGTDMRALSTLVIDPQGGMQTLMSFEKYLIENGLINNSKVKFIYPQQNQVSSSLIITKAEFDWITNRNEPQTTVSLD